MKTIVLTLSLLLAGCHTIVVKPDWPEPPNVNDCPELTMAPNTEKLSELLSVVTTNYGKYHECTARVRSWQEWYAEQKRIYNESAK